MNTAKLVELLLVAIFASAIVIPTVQRVKSWMSSDKMVEFVSVVIAFTVGFGVAVYFANMGPVDGAIVGFFSIIGAENIYKLLSDKLKTYKEVAITHDMFSPIEEDKEVEGVG